MNSSKEKLLINNLSNYIKSYRSEKKITQKQLGEIMDLKIHSVEKLERGKLTSIFSGFGLLNNLAKLQNLSISALLELLEVQTDVDYKFKKENIDDFSKQILQLLHKLPIENQIKVRDFLKKSKKQDDIAEVLNVMTSSDKVKVCRKLNKLSDKSIVYLLGFLESLDED